ncbi:MAG: DUF4194 domain-containing protein [Leptospiraceae bacterium]|nr:DUF4194 domain-containing protein [Leptospiraceae bacterium]
MNEQNKVLPYANAIIRLLQGIVYNEDKEWNELISNLEEVENHFFGLGLKVYLDESEGYCFVRQMDFTDETIQPLRLVKKIQLSYQNSILCVLLREKLLEFDAASSESGRLVLTRDEIKELIRNFLPSESNEARISDKMEASINKLVEYGFLREMNQKKDRLEVKRILRAVIDAEKLGEIKTRLSQYAENQ